MFLGLATFLVLSIVALVLVFRLVRTVFRFFSGAGKKGGKQTSEKPAKEQKEDFETNMFEVLREDYNLETAALVYSDLYEAKENEETYTFNELSNVLEKRNVSEEKVMKLREVIREELVPVNLVSKKYEIRTDDTVITTEPENALMIKTREIDGRTYILVPANGGITVNGQDVFPESEDNN